MININEETKEGHCPKCDSQNISYGCLDIIDNFLVYYPIECNDCGHEDKEFYTLTFFGHSID